MTRWLEKETDGVHAKWCEAYSEEIALGIHGGAALESHARAKNGSRPLDGQRRGLATTRDSRTSGCI